MYTLRTPNPHSFLAIPESQAMSDPSRSAGVLVNRSPGIPTIWTKMAYNLSPSAPEYGPPLLNFA